MIRRLSRIKNLGIFRDYKWEADLEEFRRYNLIYGWNGAGKTTLSRLFEALGVGSSPKYPDLQYEITASSATWKQGTQCEERIRVFNRDYVRQNVEQVGGARPIFVLGAENTGLVKQIEADEKELETKRAELTRLEDERSDLGKRKDKLFTNAARTISENATGESTRAYRRPNAESDFESLKSKKLQAPKALQDLKATLKQQQRPQLDLLSGNHDLNAEVEAIHERADSLLKQTVASDVIERLADYPDIARWVEEGLSLHSRHAAGRCEFCGQELPAERQQALSAHFNDADQALKRSVDDLVRTIEGLSETLAGLQPREPSNLYDEMADSYEEKASTFVEARTMLLDELQQLSAQLQEKKARTTEVLSVPTLPKTDTVIVALREMNAQIKAHNDKTESFETQASYVRDTLKEHYLSEIFDEVADLEDKLGQCERAVDSVKNGDPASDESRGISDLEQRLATARAKVSSSHAACQEINEKLASFLGRDELAFEVSGDGYQIKRAGQVADDLSESERTAIAFVYFVVHLSDREFSLKDGVVVIDDPISSLDANSLFQAFAFLKESVAGAKQVFILTHNFEFMRQVKNWLYHVKKRQGEPQRAFYMVNNREVESKREAFLAPLDRLLMEFQSEYHYLFSLLQAYKADGSLQAVYNFPNIGRKFLETFLAFRVPSRENLHQKMAHLEFDETKKTAILQFVQTHSHAVRSDGVLNFDMSITRGGQTAIRNLLEMVEAVDKTHYETLLATIEPDGAG